MPNFVSKEGEWYPAKEKIALKNLSEVPIMYKDEVIQPGEPFIYDGADREAVRMIKEEGGKEAEKIGEDFRQNPEFLQAVRNQGFNDVESFLKAKGYSQEKAIKEFEKKASSVKAHQEPIPVPEPYITGGGIDKTGNKVNDIIGGFGEQRVRPADEVRKKEKQS